MRINEVLKDRKISMYRLAKSSEVPYATINDICSGKSKLEKCSAETVYRIAHALDLSMEDLLSPCMVKRSSGSGGTPSTARTVCSHTVYR